MTCKYENLMICDERRLILALDALDGVLMLSVTISNLFVVPRTLTRGARTQDGPCPEPDFAASAQCLKRGA
ncbi:MAG: hypothetical protein AMJ63_12025 [Myxococcales bacterium SG8_38_1]|nr:MAG: hypothetical protein AMJ63_12025 [Myxococcales bacterium SG8_38_1]